MLNAKGSELIGMNPHSQLERLKLMKEKFMPCVIGGITTVLFILSFIAAIRMLTYTLDSCNLCMEICKKRLTFVNRSNFVLPYNNV